MQVWTEEVENQTSVSKQIRRCWVCRGVTGTIPSLRWLLGRGDGDGGAGGSRVGR